jgi:hypothetical protein
MAFTACLNLLWRILYSLLSFLDASALLTLASLLCLLTIRLVQYHQFDRTVLPKKAKGELLHNGGHREREKFYIRLKKR